MCPDPPDPLPGFASVIRSYLLVLRRSNKLTMKAMLFVFKGDITRNHSQRRFFNSDTALQHCCDFVSNGCNTVATLQRCIALKIVVANRLV